MKRVYGLSFRRRTLMKLTPWDDVRAGSTRVRLGYSAHDGSEESLFSLLLKVETRLRAAAKNDSQHGPERRKSSKTKTSPRSFSSSLSRYIE
jgi:hypothetical protein